MLASGRVVLDADGTMAALVDEARAALEAGPQIDEEGLTWLRYAAATLLEDGLDVADRDPSLEAVDADLANLARRFYRTASSEEQAALARRIVSHSVGETGFFEWDGRRAPADRSQ
jgi:hypothetical protein